MLLEFWVTWHPGQVSASQTTLFTDLNWRRSRHSGEVWAHVPQLRQRPGQRVRRHRQHGGLLARHDRELGYSVIRYRSQNQLRWRGRCIRQHGIGHGRIPHGSHAPTRSNQVQCWEFQNYVLDFLNSTRTLKVATYIGCLFVSKIWQLSRALPT